MAATAGAQARTGRKHAANAASLSLQIEPEQPWAESVEGAMVLRRRRCCSTTSRNVLLVP